MSFRLPTRRLIALAAAYVVAAQATLLPLSIAAASPMLTSICVSVADGAGHQPGDTGNGCGCAAACGVQCCAPGALDRPAAQFRLPPAVVQVLAPVEALIAVRAENRASHHPRAPPLT